MASRIVEEELEPAAEIVLTLAEPGVCGVLDKAWGETGLGCGLDGRMARVERATRSASVLHEILARDGAHRIDMELNENVKYAPLGGYLSAGLDEALGLLLECVGDDLEHVRTQLARNGGGAA